MLLNKIINVYDIFIYNIFSTNFLDAMEDVLWSRLPKSLMIGIPVLYIATMLFSNLYYLV